MIPDEIVNLVEYCTITRKIPRDNKVMRLEFLKEQMRFEKQTL